ncbi:MAG: DUF1566 domain-containing protein, partial [Amphritea sp.]|nr:DUF1566 domain-containing protein [Amphritea sp.]
MKNSLYITGLLLIFVSGYSFGGCTDFRPIDEIGSRFIVDEDLVLDTKTNLRWRRCSVGTTWVSGKGCTGRIKIMSLSAAKRLAQTLGDGWRVPDIEELYSIVEPQCSDPAVNKEIFPDIRDLGEGAPYWSISQVQELP